jgi:hypothetical protein
LLIKRNGSLVAKGYFFRFPFGVGFKSVSPLASFFLLLRQKKETKEKATPDRSKARNKINGLRRRQNSRFASVEPLRQVSA